MKRALANTIARLTRDIEDCEIVERHSKEAMVRMRESIAHTRERKHELSLLLARLQELAAEIETGSDP